MDERFDWPRDSTRRETMKSAAARSNTQAIAFRGHGERWRGEAEASPRRVEGFVGVEID